MFWRDLSIRPLKSSPSFPAGRTEAGLTKGGECPQVLQRNTTNFGHRTCKIESFSHLFLSAFNPLQPSASLLVQILYCVLLLGANTFPCSYKTPQKGSRLLPGHVVCLTGTCLCGDTLPLAVMHSATCSKTLAYFRVPEIYP